MHAHEDEPFVPCNLLLCSRHHFVFFSSMYTMQTYVLNQPILPFEMNRKNKRQHRLSDNVAEIWTRFGDS